MISLSVVLEVVTVLLVDWLYVLYLCVKVLFLFDNDPLLKSRLFRFYWLYSSNSVLSIRKELMDLLSVVPEVWVLTVLLVESRLCVLMRKSLIFVRQWSIVPYCVCQPEINPQRHVVVMNTAPWERDTVSTVVKKRWELITIWFNFQVSKRFLLSKNKKGAGLHQFPDEKPQTMTPMSHDSPWRKLLLDSTVVKRFCILVGYAWGSLANLINPTILWKPMRSWFTPLGCLKGQLGYRIK